MWKVWLKRLGVFPSTLIVTAAVTLGSVIITLWIDLLFLEDIIRFARQSIDSLKELGIDVYLLGDMIALDLIQAALISSLIAVPTIYAILSLTAKLAEAEHELRLLSSTDPLTKIYNRRYMLERAEAELLRTRRHGGTFSILMLDIDFFKQINDTYGHLAGDAVLRAVSDLFCSQVRSTDVVGRYGGEEFFALLPETHYTEAYEVAERFRKSLAAMVVTYERIELQVTASIGVAFGTCRTENLDAVLATADQLLYKAKQSGRNQVVAEALTAQPAWQV